MSDGSLLDIENNAKKFKYSSLKKLAMLLENQDIITSKAKWVL